MQCAMDRTSVGYLKQALAFGVGEVTLDHDLPVDAVHFAGFCLAFFAILGVDLLVAEAHLDLIER